MTEESPALVAESIPLPKRRLFLSRDPIPRDSAEVRGWCFVVEEVGEDGSVTPVWDTWERLFAEIVRYPPLYATGPLHWRDFETGAPVSLSELAERFE